MAKDRTCDVCGATPASRVEVAVVFEDVVGDGLVTGLSEAADACAAHRAFVRSTLHDHVTATLDEQIPYHQQLQQHTADREAAMASLAAMAPSLNMADSELPADLRSRRDTLRTQANEAEVARLGVLDTATAASDARKEALQTALHTPPA